MADRIFIDFENEYIGERLAEELAVCLDDAEIIVGAGEGFILSDTKLLRADYIFLIILNGFRCPLCL